VRLVYQNTATLDIIRLSEQNALFASSKINIIFVGLNLHVNNKRQAHSLLLSRSNFLPKKIFTRFFPLKFL
jgi:hypothetical protein